MSRNVSTPFIQFRFIGTPCDPLWFIVPHIDDSVPPALNFLQRKDISLKTQAAVSSEIPYPRTDS